MKKTAFAILILMFLLGSALSAAADGPDPDKQISPEMLDILNQNIDNIFPITSMKDFFNKPEAAIYSQADPNTVVEIENYRGRRNIRIFANPDSLHDRFGTINIDDAYPMDFHMTMNVTVGDAWPADQAGCFIGFTNYGVSAFSGEEGAATVALMTNGTQTGIYYKNRDEDSGIQYPLEAMIRTTARLTIAHLTGQTYVYINGAYAGQFHDGMDGPFRLMYGTAALKDGDSAGCTFDNLIVRKVSSKQ